MEIAKDKKLVTEKKNEDSFLGISILFHWKQYICLQFFDFPLDLFVEAFAAKFLFPPVEEKGEEYGQSPVGDGVRDVRFHTPVVKGGEDIRFGEHVHDFDCEDKGEEFDGFQIVCEEGGKRHDERLGKDDSCESVERGHAHGDGCFILAVVYGTESAADIFRLVGGVI